MAAATVERLEETLRHRRVDAWSLVDDSHLQRRGAKPARRVFRRRGRRCLTDDDIDRAVGRAVLDRVANEVVEDLFDPGRQRFDWRQAVGAPQRDRAPRLTPVPALDDAREDALKQKWFEIGGHAEAS